MDAGYVITCRAPRDGPTRYAIAPLEMGEDFRNGDLKFGKWIRPMRRVAG
jgi:hypothetical protein